MIDLTAWSGLPAAPSFWLAATVIVFLTMQGLHGRCAGHPLTHPVALSVLLLIALLSVSGTAVETYDRGTEPLRALLGPATVAMAVPIYEHRHRILRTLLPLLVTLAVGGSTAIVSVILLSRLAGLDDTMMRSLAPKSATMPIAMEVARHTGGLPALTMVFVMATGILGAIVAEPLLRRLRGADRDGFGVALGITAHGIGVARAFQSDAVMGVFTSLGMALNGVATAVLVPLLLTLFSG